MMRIALFIITNIAVMIVLGIVFAVLGLNGRLGTSYISLMVFSLVFGFTGSIISLLLSKTIAKWSMGLTMINEPQSETERWIVQTVQRLANKANIGMPDVGIYQGTPNAFATGAFKNSALVAVSTGLLETMDREEVEAVLAHEVAHIVNGDMVTMTLIQGVMNTFVILLSRVIGMVIDGFITRVENRREDFGFGYFITRIVLQIVLGFLASMVVAWFSRKREFRADAGAAKLMGRRQPMINALRRLGGVESGELPKNMQAMCIASSSIGRLFSTHPPIEDRINYLQQQQNFE